ncbi:MAG: DUF1015 domain-containing protein [Chloroflexota bacterium]
MDLRPFRAVRYTPAAGPMEQLLCPPYDVISVAQERALLARNPHNMVRLELAEMSGDAPPSRYSDAAAAFAAMQADGTLARDDAPSYYLLRQRFSMDGRTHERWGLLGALKAEELGTGVLPHEDTAPGPKADRLALMEATGANFSPIMLLYRDPSGTVDAARRTAAAGVPLADFTADDGQGYALWRLDDPSALAAIGAALANQLAYIADGHHRYETSVVYAGRHPEGGEAGSRVLACLIDFADPGLLIQPYYRVLHSLSPVQHQRLEQVLAEGFTALPAPTGARTGAALQEAVDRAAQDTVVLGIAEQGKPARLLTPTTATAPQPDAKAAPEVQVRSVEARLLQEAVFRPVLGDGFPANVAYVHDGAEALAMVERGEGQMAFFVKGVPAPVFEAVVGAGIRLPRKSTYFHPKLPSGLVIKLLVGEL